MLIAYFNIFEFVILNTNTRRHAQIYRVNKQNQARQQTLLQGSLMSEYIVNYDCKANNTAQNYVLKKKNFYFLTKN